MCVCVLFHIVVDALMEIRMSLCKYLTFNLSGPKSLAFNEPETAQLFSGHHRTLDFIVRVIERH